MTGDRSNSCAPRAAAAAARPTHARYGSRVAPSFVRSPAPASSATVGRDGAARQQRRVEAGGAPHLLLAFQHAPPVPGVRATVSAGRGCEIALHVEPAQQRREVERGPPPRSERRGRHRARRSLFRDRRIARPDLRKSSRFDERSCHDRSARPRGASPSRPRRQTCTRSRTRSDRRRRRRRQSSSRRGIGDARGRATSGIDRSRGTGRIWSPSGGHCTGRGGRDGQDGRDGQRRRVLSSERTCILLLRYRRLFPSCRSRPSCPSCPSRPRSAFLRSAPHRYPPVPPAAGTTR